MTFALPTPDAIANYSDVDDRDKFGFSPEDFKSCWPLAGSLRALYATPPQPNPHLESAMARPGFYAALDEASCDLCGYDAYLDNSISHSPESIAAIHSARALIAKAAARAAASGFSPDQADAICAEAVARMCQRSMLDKQSNTFVKLSLQCAYPSEHHLGPAPIALLREFTLGQIGSTYFSLAGHSLSSMQGSHPYGFLTDRSCLGGEALRHPPPLLSFCVRACSALARSISTEHAASNLSERDAHIALAIIGLTQERPAYPRGQTAAPAPRQGRSAREFTPLCALLEQRILACQSSSASSGSRSPPRSL